MTGPMTVDPLRCNDILIAHGCVYQLYLKKSVSVSNSGPSYMNCGMVCNPKKISKKCFSFIFSLGISELSNVVPLVFYRSSYSRKPTDN